MYEKTLQTLEVFKYAAGDVSSPLIWDKEAIERIETQVMAEPSLSRLHALIFYNASHLNHLAWFSPNAIALLKLSATKLIVDIAAKKQFIRQLVPILASHHISVILLKGMAFNKYIYTDEAPRGVSDIDILVKESDRVKFEDIFKALASKVDVEAKYAFDGLYEQTWRSNDNASHLIDVHTHLTNPILFNIDNAQLWQHSIVHPEYGSALIRVLSVEHTILHLTTHVINDTNFYHYNLVDIHRLLSTCSIDYLLMQKWAKRWGLSFASQFLIACSQTYLNTDVEYNEVEKNRRGKLKHAVAKLIINRLFLLPSIEKSPLHRIKQLCCYAFVMDNGSIIFKMSRHYILGMQKKLKR